MKSAVLRFRWAILLAFAWFGLLSCILDDRQAKRGSEVENELHGRLVDAGGVPVAGAWVVAVPSQEVLLKQGAVRQPAAVPESVQTNAQGKYRFKSLKPGEYHLTGNFRQGSLVVLIPGVYYVDTTRPQDVGVDTLRQPGSIHGGVLAGSSGRDGAMCFLPGTSYLAITDDTGGCVLQHIPQGVYRVKYALPGYSAGIDTGVVVVSGRATILPFKVLAFDTALNPPPPAELRGESDTLAGVVMLRWPSVAVGDLEGYQVWRDTGNGELPHLLTPRPVKDTFYRDTVAGLLRAGKPRVLAYRVKSVDREANTSLFFSPSVSLELVAASDIKTMIVADLPDWVLVPRVGPGDTLRFAVRYSNPTRPVLRIEWYVSDRDTLLAAKEVGAMQGRDTLRFSRDKAGRYVLRCVATDGYGRTTTREFAVEVDLLPHASRMVSIGDSVHLDGVQLSGGADSGRRYEWDIGRTGTFQTSASGKISLLAPMQAGRIDCLLRVTNADGSTRTLLFRVHVDWDFPEPVITAPPEAFAGDTLEVSGASSYDAHGRVVKWEWDFGGKGTFADGSGPVVRFPTPLRPVQDFPCSLRVTDDDGQSSTRGVLVQIRDRGTGRWVKVAESDQGYEFSRFFAAGEKVFALQSLPWGSDGDTSIPWKDETLVTWSSTDLRTWKLERKIPVPHGGGPDQVLYQGGKHWLLFNDVPNSIVHLYSSIDGLSWERLDLPEAVARRSSPTTVVFQGKLWMLGGSDSSDLPLADVWSSADGRNWTRATMRAGYGSRMEVRAAAHQDKLWVYGGVGNDGSWIQDIWSSSDGATWRWAADLNFLPDYMLGRMVSSDGKLWLAGVKADEVPDLQKTMLWTSDNGVKWSLASEETGMPDPIMGSFLEFKGRLWFLTGQGEAWLAP